ncbi:MAG: cupin domain-containing protein [Candidatus Bathyarchaeia archaeon]
MVIIDPKKLKLYRLGEGIFRKEIIRGDHLLVTWNWAQPNAEAKMHKHDCEQVVYLLMGALEVTIDGKTEIAEAEAVIYIPSGAMHSVKVIGEEPLISIDIYAPPLQKVIFPEKRNDDNMQKTAIDRSISKKR